MLSRLASAEEETRLRYQAALAAENARTENQRLSRQEEETRLRYQAALAAEKMRENQRSSSRYISTATSARTGARQQGETDNQKIIRKGQRGARETKRAQGETDNQEITKERTARRD